MSYVPKQVTLSQAQSVNLLKSKAVRLTYAQLEGGSKTLYLTPREAMTVEKHLRSKKGITLGPFPQHQLQMSYAATGSGAKATGEKAIELPGMYDVVDTGRMAAPGTVQAVAAIRKTHKGRKALVQHQVGEGIFDSIADVAKGAAKLAWDNRADLAPIAIDLYKSNKGSGVRVKKTRVVPVKQHAAGFFDDVLDGLKDVGKVAWDNRQELAPIALDAYKMYKGTSGGRLVKGVRKLKGGLGYSQRGSSFRLP